MKVQVHVPCMEFLLNTLSSAQVSHIKIFLKELGTLYLSKTFLLLQDPKVHYPTDKSLP